MTENEHLRHLTRRQSHAPRARRVTLDALAAGGIGAVGSALPSTAWALLRREDVLDGARAAGAMVLPDEQRTPVLVAAAVPVHLALSFGWAAILAAALPPRREPAWGMAAGLLIAAVDLGVIGRRIDPIRRLPQPRQWADHAAYGLAVGLTLHRRRRRRAPSERPAM